MEVFDTNIMISGKEYIINGKIYVKCGDCGRVIEVGNWFGSLHICK